MNLVNPAGHLENPVTVLDRINKMFQDLHVSNLEESLLGRSIP